MMTMTGHLALEQATEPGPDDDARWWLTARGAHALGRQLVDVADDHAIVCWSDEFQCWVLLG